MCDQRQMWRKIFPTCPYPSNSTKISYSERRKELPSLSLSDIGRTLEVEEQPQLCDLTFL